MKQSLLFFLLRVTFCTLCFTFATTETKAQITPDTTLPNNTEVNPTPRGVKIDGGTRREGNLFHSFKDFSIRTGSEAFFNNAPDVVNIINRVTGGNLSSIDGLIRASGSANLFLINPAGIIFGSNARLDIGGSFYGSTADSLLFENGREFSAIDPEAPSTLIINAPIGFSLRDNPQPVQVRNSVTEINTGIIPNAGANLVLLGGNIFLDASTLNLTGGTIEIGGLAEAGTVRLNKDGNLTFPDGVKLADILLNGSSLSITGASGGDIIVNANNLELSQSIFFAGILPDSDTRSPFEAANIKINATSISLQDSSQLRVDTSGEGSTGTININAKNIVLDNSFIASTVDTTGTGNSGDININTDLFELSNNSFLGTVTFGRGNTGDVRIKSRIIELNQSLIRTFIGDSGEGNAGDIILEINDLSITNGGQISAGVLGKGNAGNVKISVSDAVSLDGASSDGFGSGIFSFIDQTGQGNAGNIELNTGLLSVTNGGQISASNFGQGNGGNVIINASDAILLDGVGDERFFGSGISSFVGETAQGNAGDIRIKAGLLSLSNGAQINAATFGLGNSGNIDIATADRISINGTGSGIFSNVAETAQGDAGDIKIQAGSLFLSNGAQINAATFGLGNSGNIAIATADEISINGTGSGILSNLGLVGSIGNGGDISITTPSLSLKEGGQISASVSSEDATSFGRQGNGGNIEINALDVNISGVGTDGSSSGLFTNLEPRAEGSAGNIQVNTRNFRIADGATVTADSQGLGNGGNLLIQADSLTLDNNASLSATTASGFGGNTAILVNDILELKNNSSITVGAFGEANGGNINIEAGFVVAFPSQIPNDGNDIISFAELGRGGNINITTQTLFGLEIRRAIPGNGTNDIDAGNEFSAFTLPKPVFVEPNLSANSFVPPDTVANPACDPDKIADDILNDRESRLTIKGSGGVRPLPGDPLTSDAIHINGETVSSSADALLIGGEISSSSSQLRSPLEEEVGRRELGDRETSPPSPSSNRRGGAGGEVGLRPDSSDPEEEEKEDESPTEYKEGDATVYIIEEEENPEAVHPEEIIPARGMIVKPNGDIILTAYPTPNVAPRVPYNSPNCGI